MKNNIQDRFLHKILSMEKIKAQNIISEFLYDKNISVIENLIVPVLDEIGKLWQSGKIALSQVYMSGRICEDILSNILPESAENVKKLSNTAIVVLEDYHVLGKSIVLSMLRASGIEILDLGILQTNEIIKIVKNKNIKLLLISVLMLPSALKIKIIKEQCKNVKIVVGGAPFRFDDNLWKKVGAYKMCKGAEEAINIVKMYNS